MLRTIEPAKYQVQSVTWEGQPANPASAGSGVVFLLGNYCHQLLSTYFLLLHQPCPSISQRHPKYHAIANKPPPSLHPPPPLHQRNSAALHPRDILPLTVELRGSRRLGRSIRSRARVRQPAHASREGKPNDGNGQPSGPMHGQHGLGAPSGLPPHLSAGRPQRRALHGSQLHVRIGDHGRRVFQPWSVAEEGLRPRGRVPR